MLGPSCKITTLVHTRLKVNVFINTINFWRIATCDILHPELNLPYHKKSDN